MSRPNVGELLELLAAAEEMVLADWAAYSDGSGGTEPHVTGMANTGIDRIAQIGAVLIDEQENAFYTEVIDTLVRLFREAGDRHALGGQAADTLRANRWRDVAVRVYTLGAISVQRSSFVQIPYLVLQRSDPRRVQHYWLRETVTQLASAGRFDRNSILPLVSDYVGERDVFYRRFRSNKDEVVNALCQFDFLQCVTSVAATDDLHACYPNFGAFFNERTEPIVESLVTRGPARAVVPNLSDDRMAAIVVQLDELANELFFSYAAWHKWDWNSEVVRSFLREYARGHS